ncbi:MAG: sulfite exporter TauE/SafE family protein [Calditrichia bacterium]
MIHLFHIPTRFAIGSNLGIVFLSALAGLAGKEITGQIPWMLAAALVAGAFPGAQLGAHVSCMIKTRYFRIGIHLLIAMAGIRIWYQVFAGH